MPGYFINSRLASYDFDSLEITPNHIAAAIDSLNISDNVFRYSIINKDTTASALFYLKNPVKIAADSYSYSPEEHQLFSEITSLVASQGDVDPSPSNMYPRVKFVNDWLDGNGLDMDMYKAWLEDNNSYSVVFGNFAFKNLEDAMSQAQADLESPETLSEIRETDEDQTYLSPEVLEIENNILNGYDKADVRFVPKENNVNGDFYTLKRVYPYATDNNKPNYINNDPRSLKEKRESWIAVFKNIGNPGAASSDLHVFTDDIKNNFIMTTPDKVEKILKKTKPTSGWDPSESSENNAIYKDTFPIVYLNILYTIADRPASYFKDPALAFNKLKPVLEQVLTDYNFPMKSFNYFVNSYGLKKINELFASAASGEDLTDYFSVVDEATKVAPEELSKIEQEHAEAVKDLSVSSPEIDSLRKLYFKDPKSFKKTQQYTDFKNKFPDKAKDLLEMFKYEQSNSDYARVEKLKDIDPTDTDAIKKLSPEDQEIFEIQQEFKKDTDSQRSTDTLKAKNEALKAKMTPEEKDDFDLKHKELTDNTSREKQKQDKQKYLESLKKPVAPSIEEAVKPIETSKPSVEANYNKSADFLVRQQSKNSNEDLQAWLTSKFSGDPKKEKDLQAFLQWLKDTGKYDTVFPKENSQDIRKKYNSPEAFANYQKDFELLSKYKNRENPVSGAKLKEAVENSKKSPEHKYHFYNWLKSNKAPSANMSMYDFLFSDNKAAMIIAALIKFAFEEDTFKIDLEY